jgi:type IV pilus assembly protein PilW
MIKNTQQLRVQSGFTIIELMVGMVIGLVATVVIMQTFSNFEGNKRSATGITDAQTNGSIGLYMIQRELQFAGYGIPAVSGVMPDIAVSADQNTFADYTDEYEAGLSEEDIKDLQDAAETAAKARYTAQLNADALTVAEGEVYSALKCNETSPLNTINLDTDSASSRANATRIVRDIITPVRITDGANSDIITIHYGTTNRGAMPTTITGPPAGANVPVSNNLGCRPNDIVLVTKNSNAPANNTDCTVSQVTSNLAALNTGPTNTLSVASTAGMAQGDRLACLGQIKEVTFDVDANQLRKSNLATGVQEAALSEIVSLQAQYGVSATANSEVVNQWVDAAGATWAAPSVANRNRIKAVRVAIVARNNLLERAAVSQACNGAAADAAKVCVFGANIAFANADWPNYRYRVYELMVPLRNMLAASPQL